jgi:hypothetical protein
MLFRILSISTNTNDYIQLRIANIAGEFKRNFVQQIYNSETTWTAICVAKNAITNKLREVTKTGTSANNLRGNICI